MKKIDVLASVNSPSLVGDQFYAAFDEYVTISDAYNAISSAITFIVQLLKAHDAGKINLTDADRVVLMENYAYLAELVDGYDD
jgi:hypothetical protein